MSPPAGAMDVSNGSAAAGGLSKDEAAVYDRQIRLWGIDAQNKLRNSSVLIVGLTQLGSEFAKNITLAGLKSLTLMDGENVTEEDIGQNFLYNVKDGENLVGKNKAEVVVSRMTTLNPNVNLSFVPVSLYDQMNIIGEHWLHQFSLVALIDQDYELVERVNVLCRILRVQFISASVFGWIGYAFFDFNKKHFLTKVQNKETEAALDLEKEGGTSKVSTVTVDEDQFESKIHKYPSFKDAFHVDWSAKKLLRKCKRIIPPSYFLVKSILRAQKEKLFNGNEENDLAVLEKIWDEEVVAGNHTKEMQTVQPEKFDHLFNPQLTPTCAIVGGMMGQEAIKALSGGKNPLRNIFIYSALDTTGIVCDFPPTA